MGIEDDLRSRIGELEAENEKLREEGHLTEAEIIEILDGNAAFLDKRHAEIDAIEQRADRLAVVADALASECEELKTRAERAEAKLRNLAETAAWRDECNAIASWFELPSISTFTDQWDDADAEFANTKSKAEADYQAALKAAIGDLYENN